MQRTQIRHLSIFLFLSLSLMLLNTIAYNIAISIFLTHAGSENLPIAYILLGLLSIPMNTAFAQVVDRGDRVQLFSYLLLGTIAMYLGIRLLLNLESILVAYFIFVAVYFQWNLILNIMLPSLLTDYFTTLDWKRYSPFIAMSQGVGGILGGGLTSWLSRYMKTENMLLVLPIFSIVALGQIIYLSRSKKPITTRRVYPPTKFSEKTKELASLIKKYPVIFLLAINSIIYMQLLTLAEFEYFSIYAQVFSDPEKLTSFLGQMRMINSSLQLLILYLFTKPLIQRLPVSRANLVYALTTLGSFLTLAFQFNLRGAIVLDLNNDALVYGINLPVNTLNYNALPYKIVGQARSICEGLFYFIGLALAGGLLWVAQRVLTPFQMGLIGIGLSIVFLVLRYQLGKSYLPTLRKTLQSSSVASNQVIEGLRQLPASDSSEIRQLLSSDQPSEQILGIELATRLHHPSQVLSSVVKLLENNPSAEICQEAIKFLRIADVNISRYLGSLLRSDNISLQRIALEALIASRQKLTDEEIQWLLRTTPKRTLEAIIKARQESLNHQSLNRLFHEGTIIQTLACIAATEAGSTNPEIQAVCQKIWSSPLDSQIQLMVIRSIRQSQNPDLIKLIVEIIPNALAEVKVEGLRAIAELADPEDEQLAEIAAVELTDSNPLVMANAFHLLGTIRNPKLLPQLALGLEHENLAVRFEAASALAKYGNLSFSYSQTLLDSHRWEVLETAIAAIAKVGNRRAKDILYNYLKPKYRLLSDTIRWRQFLPSDYPDWQFLDLTLKDYQMRLVHLVLYIVSQIDHDGTFRDIRLLVNESDDRIRANAIEALSSGIHRKFILPVVPLLENPDGATSAPIWTSFMTKNELCEKLTQAGDRWLTIAALLLTKKTTNFKQISDPTLRSLVEYLDSTPKPEDDFFINRLVFLKNVSLLNSLFLDELLQVNTALIEENYDSGQTIGTQGQTWDKLLIVYQGSIVMSQSDSAESIHLKQGEYFGEMALLMDDSLEWTIVANSDTQLLTLSRDRFQPLIGVCPRLLTCLSHG